MSFILLLSYLIILCLIIYKGKFFRTNLFSSHVVCGVFISKFIMGVILVLIYSYYYGSGQSGDIFKYYDDGNIIHSSLRYSVWDYLRMVTGIDGSAPHLEKYYETCAFWYKGFNYGLLNDNRIVIRFNAIVRLISMGNIYIHTLFMSFVSFAGLWGIFKVFEKLLKHVKWLLLFVIFFLPSVWFWTSGLLKEGILMGALGMLVYAFNHIIHNGVKVKTVFGVLLLLFLLLQSKFYVLVAAIPGLLFLFTHKYFKINKWIYFVAVHGLVLLLAASSKYVGYNFLELIENKQHDFVNYVNSLNEVGSLITIPDLEPTIWSVIKNSPNAFMNTMFRPFIWEASGILMLMAAFENLIILAGVVITLLFLKIDSKLNPYFYFSLSFVICLFVISGLTTPVLGALVRYKAPALPFLGAMLLFVFNSDKVKRGIGRLINRKSTKVT